MEEAIKDYLRFLSRPGLHWTRMVPEKLNHIVILFFLVFTIELILAGLLFNAIGVEESAHKLDDLLDQLSLWKIFILAVIIAPIFEELVFRYYLTKPVLVFIALPIIVALGSMALYSNGSLSLFALLLLLIASSLTILVLFWKSVNLIEQLKIWYQDKFPYIFYTSAALFAFIHIYNFHDMMPWYYTPILVFPQFFIGLYLGYLRVRNGLSYSILVHAINNAIPMVLLALGEQFINGQ